MVRYLTAIDNASKPPDSFTSRNTRSICHLVNSVKLVIITAVTVTIFTDAAIPFFTLSTFPAP